MKGAAAALAMLIAVSGCGGGGSSRPSVDELADAIRGGSSGIGVPADKADCVAELFVDSDMSDKALQRYLGDGPDSDLDDADDAAFNGVVSRFDECDVSLPGG